MTTALFALGFMAVWLVATSFLGLVSGWYGLMRRYPDREETALLRLCLRSGSLRGTNFGGILTLSVCPSGLRVAVWRLFGPFDRPFLVPWRDIAVEPRTIFFQPMARLRFGVPAAATLSIDVRTWERLSTAARTATSAVPPPLPPLSNEALARGCLLQWAAITALAGAFFAIASRIAAHGAAGVPLPVCFGFPALVFGVSQAARYLMQRR